MFIKKEEYDKLKERISFLEDTYFAEKINNKIKELENKFNVKILFHYFSTTIEISINDMGFNKSSQICGDFNPSVITNRYEYVMQGLEKDIVNFLYENDLIVMGGKNNDINK